MTATPNGGRLWHDIDQSRADTSICSDRPEHYCWYYDEDRNVWTPHRKPTAVEMEANEYS